MIFGALTLADRIDLGARVVGRVVVVEREPTRSLPRALSLLLRVLHAALLARAGARARKHVRRLRAVRRRADSRLVPRDQALAEVHPSGRVQLARPADDRLAVLHVLRLARGDAGALRDAVQVELAGKRLDAHVRELRELLDSEHEHLRPSGSTWRGVSRRVRRGARVGRDHRARSCSGCSGRSATWSSSRAIGARWLRRSSGRRCSATARRRSRTLRSHLAGRDVGRPARVARPDGAARCPGGHADGVPVVDVVGLAQPVRLARRRRVPDLGLPPALPPARPRR